jgi:hypothetical protein
VNKLIESSNPKDHFKTLLKVNYEFKGITERDDEENSSLYSLLVKNTAKAIMRQKTFEHQVKKGTK